MTRDFTRILVPTDFSAPSNGALALAKTLATTFGASLHLVHVLDDPFVTGAFAPDAYVPPPAAVGRTGTVPHDQSRRFRPTRMAHLFVGSVAERVVRTALCPVLTVREPLAGSRQTATAA
jgi:nucleotide-binding universal stress UspA family protein